MKKILSLTLAVLMVVSIIPTAFAAETQDYSLGTAVTIEGAGGEYTVTVPATLTPGQTGTVTAKGYWASNETLKVSAPATIEVTDGVQKTNINVSFAGIESAGSDLDEMNISVNISIDNGGIKFGEWTGTIVYNVELDDGSFDVQIKRIYASGGGFTSTIKVQPNMTWADWIASDYNNGNYYISDNNTVMQKGNPNDLTIHNETGAVLPTDVISQSIAYTFE